MQQLIKLSWYYNYYNECISGGHATTNTRFLLCAPTTQPVPTAQVAHMCMTTPTISPWHYPTTATSWTPSREEEKRRRKTRLQDSRRLSTASQQWTWLADHYWMRLADHYCNTFNHLCTQPTHLIWPSFMLLVLFPQASFLPWTSVHVPILTQCLSLTPHVQLQNDSIENHCTALWLGLLLCTRIPMIPVLTWHVNDVALPW